MEKLGPLSYKVKVGNEVWLQHIDQLLATSELSFATNNDSFEVWPNCSGPGVSDDTPTRFSSEQCQTNTEPHYPQ